MKVSWVGDETFDGSMGLARESLRVIGRSRASGTKGKREKQRKRQTRDTNMVLRAPNPRTASLPLLCQANGSRKPALTHLVVDNHIYSTWIPRNAE